MVVITNLYLEELLNPYSKAPVEYPESINSQLVDYMKYQQQKIKDSSDFAEAWHSLLVGQIKVLYTILCENNISSTVYKGTFNWRNKKKWLNSLTIFG